jgi:hypothetical protein
LYYSYINFIYDDISWSNSKIREWLNSKFMNNAFDRNELQYIIDNTVSPTIINVEITKAKRKQKINFQYEDKVFLLGRDELEYFSKIITLQESGESGASDNDDTTYWLSYPVYDNFTRVADKYGKITRRSWRRTSGVRPAIWIHI